MKSTITNEPKWYIKFITFFVMGFVTMFCALSLSAQEKKESDWKEMTTIEIPNTVEIHTGITKNGNPKYWIEVQGIKVTISEGNYNKFINKEVDLVLVEWYNATTDKYKYTTRQANKTKTNNKLNVDNLW